MPPSVVRMVRQVETALCGVRGNVAGDVIRKLLARTVAQQRPLHRTSCECSHFGSSHLAQGFFSDVCSLASSNGWIKIIRPSPVGAADTSPEASRRQWKGRKVCEGALAERCTKRPFPEQGPHSRRVGSCQDANADETTKLLRRIWWQKH